MSTPDRRKEIFVEKLIEGVGSVYKLVNLAARRALEISEGSPRLVEANAKEKPAITALREISENKVSLRILQKKPAKG